MARLLVGAIPFEPDRSPELASLALAVAEASRARTTLIAPDGRVLADSELDAVEVAALDGHRDRPEVAEALAGRIGRSHRFSTTTEISQLYVALPRTDAATGAVTGVVRLALSSERADRAVVALRRDLLSAAALGLLAALALSYALSWLVMRPVRDLAEVVSDVATGQLGRQLRFGGDDERGLIVRAINRMAQQMRDQLAGAASERAQLDSVLSSMIEGVLVLDAERRIVLANPRLRELLTAWGEIEGRPLGEVFREPAVEEAFREACASDGPVVRDIALARTPPRVLGMHAARFPQQGPRAGTVIVVHDVTEVRRVDEIRRDFIANASHELRTPLTAIQGFADTLANREVEPEQRRHYLEVIARNAQRMADLVDDLLALSRIERGRAAFEISDVDAGRVAEMAVADFRSRFEQAGLALELELRPTPPARTDRRALEQILDNLLSNAARYTNAGGHVKVTVEPADGGVAVRVADDGIGIPEHAIERIFERFYRVDAARSRALGSTGLGLAIVKHLVAEMGGEIEVESQLGKGSRFSVVLPASA